MLALRHTSNEGYRGKYGCRWRLVRQCDARNIERKTLVGKPPVAPIKLRATEHRRERDRMI